MNFNIFSAFVIFVAATQCSGHIGGHSYNKLQDLEPQVYCGRNLARVLASLCYDVVNKRSGIMDNMNNEINGLSYKEGELAWPWMSSHKSRVLGAPSREMNMQVLGLPSRSKRTIVEECCDKPCSIDELITYC